MKKSIIVYAHIFFWLALIATNVSRVLLLRYLSPKEFGMISYYSSFLNPVFFYVGYLFVMRIKWNRPNIGFTILGIGAIYLILFLISPKVLAYGITPISSIFLWVTIGGLFRFFIDWFKKKNEVLILEKENISSNLALLKTQINPHFLFNTLNNIDTLIYDNQDKASKSLVKLSHLMRYMLNDAQSDFVALQKEIDHLEDYLSLEKLRLKNENFLSYTSSGNFEGLKIAPMILNSFVENAFKHSVDSDIENGIVIKLNRENRNLTFVCENQYNMAFTDKDKTHGIGLNTVKKRLDLIYKNKYNLTIKSDHSVYKVYLKIELNEN